MEVEHIANSGHNLILAEAMAFADTLTVFSIG